MTVVTTREALLDAAYDAALAGGWAQVRMADVAAAAGVSRQTLYYEFGSKDALAQALAVREADRWTAGADAARVGHEGTPAEAVAASMLWTLEEAARNPLLKAVLTDDSAALLPFLTTRADRLLATACDRTSTYLAARWPDLAAGDIRLVADVVNRLTFSHLVLPGERPDQVAADITRLVQTLLPGEPS